MRLLPALLLLAAALAGCSGKSADEPVPTPPHPLAAFPELTLAADGSVSMALDATDCNEGILVVPVEPEYAQSQLPPGWMPADLGVLLDTPASTGMAAAWLNAYTCDGPEGHVEGAELGFVIQPPTLQNGTADDAAMHIYELAHATRTPALAAALAYAGVPVLDAAVTTPPGSPLPVGLSTYTLSSTNASHTFQAVAVSTETLTTSANFWSATTKGLTYTHYELAGIPIQQGVASQCALEGLSATIAGTESCTPGSALVMLAPEQAWKATFHFLPGASVA